MPDAAGPAVSVIVATFNREATLRLALESILRQDFGDFEVLVVGDACTDGSEAAVAALGDPRLHWTNLPTNCGSQSGPNNEGLRLARGRYVAYLGHDDLWLPWHLSGLVAQRERTGAPFHYTLSAAIGPDRWEAVGPPGGTRTLDKHWIPPSSWLHDREVPTEIGGWRDHDGRGLSTDIEFMRRASRHGVRIEYCPQLSVLKFPSPWWGTYSRDDAFPQEEYSEALRLDPDRLHRRVLTELATAYALTRDVVPRPRQAMKTLLLSIGTRLIECYGEERWPVRDLLRRRADLMRARQRKRRGLPPRSK